MQNQKKIKKQRIQKIISEKYNQKDQMLDLGQEKEYWTDVLLARDWTILKTLYLAQCGITDVKISVLFKLDWSKLDVLYLDKNNLIRREMRLMLNCNLTNLKGLSLCKSIIGNNGVKWLVKSHLPNLESLCLVYNRIGSEGMRHFTKGRWPILSSLSLGYFQVEDDNDMQLSGWETIAQVQSQKLQHICLRSAEPIFWMNFVPIQAKAPKLFQNGIIIQNEKFKYQIREILKNRNAFYD